jgi:hypothetical protein
LDGRAVGEAKVMPCLIGIKKKGVFRRRELYLGRFKNDPNIKNRDETGREE